MAKTTKALSGMAKRKYFRDALLAEPAVPPEAAERLAARFDHELTQMRVRNHVSLRRPVTPVASHINAAGRAPVAPSLPEPVAPAARQTPGQTSAFDPHAFSLIVVMTKQGSAGLEKTLAAIEDPEHLRALARAQHVAIDSALDQPSELRAAIIAGTAQRIADRRAAAS
jgi:hypothetical protein